MQILVAFSPLLSWAYVCVSKDPKGRDFILVILINNLISQKENANALVLKFKIVYIFVRSEKNISSDPMSLQEHYIKSSRNLYICPPSLTGG